MLWATDFFPLWKKVSGVQILLAIKLFNRRTVIGPLNFNLSSFQLWRKNTSIVYSYTNSKKKKKKGNIVICGNTGIWKLYSYCSLKSRQLMKLVITRTFVLYITYNVSEAGSLTVTTTLLCSIEQILGRIAYQKLNKNLSYNIMEATYFAPFSLSFHLP